MKTLILLLLACGLQAAQLPKSYWESLSLTATSGVPVSPNVQANMMPMIANRDTFLRTTPSKLRWYHVDFREEGDMLKFLDSLEPWQSTVAKVVMYDGTYSRCVVIYPKSLTEVK